MVSKAEVRTTVTSVADVITTIDGERDLVWEVPPAEVLALSRGEVPRGTGGKNNYLSTLIFAENELRTLTDEVLWFAWLQATTKPETHLPTLVAYLDEMCQYKGNMFDYVGLPEAGEIMKLYVGGILAASSLEELADLTKAAMTYFNRVHGWVDIAFPWGLINGFKRVNPLQAVVDAHSA